MNKETILQRLSRIKLLYKLGVDLSFQSEVTSYFSILAFHDCIEMFLILASDKKGIIINSNQKFMDYFKDFPDLSSHYGNINKLNLLRKTIKHHGVIPGKIEIEEIRIHIKIFFDENTPKLFELSFNDISLLDLIIFERTKTYLKEAQNFLDTGKEEECVEELTKAFYELLFEYKSNKDGWYSRDYFKFFETIRYPSSRFSHNNDNPTEKNIEVLVEKINENFENIENTIEVLALGIDYRKYIKFKILTPICHRMGNGNYHQESLINRNWSKENCQFLIDFVLECCIRLQDFNFDFKSLNTTNPFENITWKA